MLRLAKLYKADDIVFIYTMAEKVNHAELIRVLSTDIPATMSLRFGLARIKGISVMFANAMCVVLNLDKNKKIAELTEDEIKRIEDFLSNPNKEGIPTWLLNQQKEYETGENLHFAGKDLDFNLLKTKRRLFKLKTNRGLRLKQGLPVRGQRTKANFRRSKTLAAMKSKAGGRK